MDPQRRAPKKIEKTFFQREETVEVAKETVGKVLVTEFNGVKTGGIITEVEAYLGASDKACHAYNYRRTPRTEVMFEAGGVAYVYLCYGMHHLFNIVTHFEGEPHALLIRAIKPLFGIDAMLQRRKKTKVDKTLSGGPGTVSKALGITTAHTGTSLLNQMIYLEDHGYTLPFKTTPRIGIDYAEEDRHRPWRFVAE